MANKLGKASERYTSNHQASGVVEKINAMMEKHGIVQNAIRDLDDEPDPILMVPTGTLMLDHHLKGGIPPRSICEFYGESQGGKSWLAQKVMAVLTQRFQRALFVDAEVGFNPFRAQEIGVLLDYTSIFDSYVGGSDVLEMITDLISDSDIKPEEPFIQKQPYDLYVIDSIAVLPSDQQIKGDGSLGDRARMISKWQREILPALSRSVGTWHDTYKGSFRWGLNTVPITPKGFGEALWKQMEAAGKKRKKIDNGKGDRYDHYDEEIIAAVGKLPEELLAFEEEVGLKVIEMKDGEMSFQRYSNGPIVLVVNQTRFTDFGSYTGPKKQVTGGKASLYMATTRIEIEPVGGKAGKIINPKTNEIEFYLSRAKIVKSRFTKQVIAGIEIKIPAGETGKDDWDELLELLLSKDLYWWGYGAHHIPKPKPKTETDPAVESFIKTRDNVDFLQGMLGGGLDYCGEELGWTQEQLEPYRAICERKMAEYMGAAVAPNNESEESPDESAEDEEEDE